MPPSACSNRPIALLVGAGEGALLVTEQLRFEEVLLQRRAVHLHEVASRAQRVVVRRPGDQLLTGTRLAADEHGRIALRHFLDDRQHRLQGAARADDAVEVVDVLLRVAEVFDLVLEAAVLEGLLDLELHLLDLERLLHVVEGADLHRLDRRVHGAEGGHEDDGRGRLELARRAEHVHAVAAAHLEIAQHDVVLPLVELLDRHVAVRRLVHVVVRVRQCANDAAPQRIVVVSYQYPAHRSFLFLFTGASPPDPPSPSLAGAPCPAPLRRARPWRV